MGERRASVADFTAIFTELSFMASLFFQFSFLQTDVAMEIEILPWACMAFLTYLLNLWVTRRGCTIPQLAAMGAAIYVVQLALVFLFFSSLQGIGPHLFAVLFVGIAVFRCAYICVVPIPRDRYLGYTECAIIGTALLIFTQIGVVAFPPLYNVCLFASVVLSFLSTVRARVTSDKSETLSLSKGQGIVALCAIAAVAAALLFAAGSMFALPVRQGLQTAVVTGVSAIKAILGAVGAFILWLFSLLPAPDQQAYDMGEPLPGMGMAGEPEMDLQMLPGWVLALLVVAALAAACILAVILLRKMRLLRVQAAPRGKTAVKRRKSPLSGAFGRWFAAKWLAVKFFWCSLWYKNTPQGLMVFLENWGRAHKIPRGQGETCRCYLKRLTDAAGMQDETLRARLSELCIQLDRFYFGPEDRDSLRHAMPGKEISTLRRACRKYLLANIKIKIEREKKSMEENT